MTGRFLKSFSRDLKLTRLAVDSTRTSVRAGQWGACQKGDRQGPLSVKLGTRNRKTKPGETRFYRHCRMQSED
ncbi:hypothetical protein BaRGS_00015326 [Batillaria attramentaria]|uniref:Uncharacterized protein n=1 Tax=Batillaria attramentaria TaxID=370345 RepID=A0ABD0L254_9CAEN